MIDRSGRSKFIPTKFMILCYCYDTLFYTLFYTLAYAMSMALVLLKSLRKAIELYKKAENTSPFGASSVESRAPNTWRWRRQQKKAYGRAASPAPSRTI